MHNFFAFQQTYVLRVSKDPLVGEKPSSSFTFVRFDIAIEPLASAVGDHRFQQITFLDLFVSVIVISSL